MPAHEVKRADLAATINRLEAAGSVIKDIKDLNRKTVLVLEYTPKRGTPLGYETRPELAGLTHAARVGAMETRAEWDRDPLLHSFLTDDVVTDGDA